MKLFMSLSYIIGLEYSASDIDSLSLSLSVICNTETEIAYLFWLVDYVSTIMSQIFVRLCQ
jgi:hypothetical protein